MASLRGQPLRILRGPLKVCKAAATLSPLRLFHAWAKAVSRAEVGSDNQSHLGPTRTKAAPPGLGPQRPEEAPPIRPAGNVRQACNWSREIRNGCSHSSATAKLKQSILAQFAGGRAQSRRNGHLGLPVPPGFHDFPPRSARFLRTQQSQTEGIEGGRSKRRWIMSCN